QEPVANPAPPRARAPPCVDRARVEPAWRRSQPDRADAADPPARGGDARRTHAPQCGRAGAPAPRAPLGRRAAVEVERRAARGADRARGGAVRRRLIAAALALVSLVLHPVVGGAG